MTGKTSFTSSYSNNLLLFLGNLRIVIFPSVDPESIMTIFYTQVTDKHFPPGGAILIQDLTTVNDIC